MGVAISALILLAGCSAPGAGNRDPVAYEVEPWSYRGHEGRLVRTEHYAIHTTLTDEYLLGGLAELIETAFDYYLGLVPPVSKPAEPMPVYLFATRPDWAHFTREFTGPRAREFLQVRHGGYSEQGVSVIQYTAHQTSFPLMAHEGFHQYLHHYVNPHVPAWLNEGLAVACEGPRWEGPRIREFDPWHNPRRRNTLAEALVRKRLYSLSELLSTHAGQIVSGTDREVGTYYAQLWALVLFLKDGADGKYTERYQRMLQHLGPAEMEAYSRAAYVASDSSVFDPGAALFRSFFGDEQETIEREYVEFMRRRILNAR